jgi:DNA polymerase
MGHPEIDVTEALSSGLRGAIVASPGHHLYVADYAAIEARVVLWLAGAEKALDIFRRGEDIYCWMASKIYDKVCNKSDHPSERQLGKVAVLGLGYGMGAAKFVDSCAAYGITIEEDFAQQVVQTYRSQFWHIKEMWGDQEAAAIAAVRSKDRVSCGRVAWLHEHPFLFCELPSGRRLAYPFPQIKPRATPWGDMRASLSYMGTNTYSHAWTRQTSYGGMLVENITQAVARDIMAEAMLACEWTGVYKPLLSVHDEIIAEAPEGEGSVKEFVGILETVPEWAEGCPIAAEGWSGTRYHK